MAYDLAGGRNPVERCRFRISGKVEQLQRRQLFIYKQISLSEFTQGLG
jgi:hypothetical protein